MPSPRAGRALLGTTSCLLIVVLVTAVACSGDSPTGPVGASPADSAAMGGGVELPGQVAAGPVTVDPGLLRFGELRTRRILNLTNTSEHSVRWTTGATVSWLAASPGSGELPPGGSTRVAVVVDRSSLPQGNHVGSLTVLADGHSARILTRLRVAAVLPPPTGFSARVVDIFTGSGLVGMTVTVAGETLTTDANGIFTTRAAAAGTETVALSGAGHVMRETYASAANPDATFTMIPRTFDIDAYDDIALEFAAGRSVRWVSDFTIYVDSRPETGTGKVIPKSWLDATVAAVEAYPALWTNGAYSPVVVVGTTPPPDGTPGTIVIRYDNTINPTDCGGLIGTTSLSWAETGAMRWGLIRLAFSRACAVSSAGLQAIVGHELGHAMGLGHSISAGSSSLMEPVIRFLSPTPLDHQIARVHYGRRVGHAAPDKELAPEPGVIAPRLLARGPVQHTFNCGAIEP